MLLDKSNYYQVMKALYNKSGLLAKDIAPMMGVNHGQIYRWMNGDDVPRATRMFEFIAICGGKVTLEGLE